jgi:hypothetical protein
MKAKEYIDLNYSGKKSASKCWAFYKSLVLNIAETSDFDDARFLVDKADAIVEYLNKKTVTTRNRYATHVLCMFDFVQHEDAEEMERCRALYRKIVKDTKRVMRKGEKKTDEDSNGTPSSSNAEQASDER